jgi:hypothetical protein
MDAWVCPTITPSSTQQMNKRPSEQMEMINDFSISFPIKSEDL